MGGIIYGDMANANKPRRVSAGYGCAEDHFEGWLVRSSTKAGSDIISSEPAGMAGHQVMTVSKTLVMGGENVAKACCWILA
jgi:hypothetical protein